MSGAWGKSTLDVAADGTKTSTKSGLVITDFENKEGMSFAVTGKFSETNVGGTFLVSGSSGSVNTGTDIESVLNEDRQHFLDDTTISGDTAGFSLTFSGPDYKFALGTSSGSGSTTVHHLDERFLGETQTSGNEWTTVKGTGGSSSGGSYAATVGGMTLTTTNSMASTSESDGGVSRVYAVFASPYGSSGGSYGSSAASTFGGSSGTGSSGYGTTGWQPWQLDGFTGNAKGQTTTTTTDGSQTQVREMHGDVTASLSPTTGGGTQLDLSGGYGRSETTTTPGPYGSGGSGSGSVTTVTQEAISLNGFTFQVADDTALTLIDTPLSRGTPWAVFSISPPGITSMGGILVDPPGTLLLLPNLGGALGTAMAAAGTATDTAEAPPVPPPMYTTPPTATAADGDIAFDPTAAPLPTPTAVPATVTASIGGGMSPILPATPRPLGVDATVTRTPMYDETDNDGDGEREWIGSKGDDGTVVRTVRGVKYTRSTADAEAVASTADLTKEEWDAWFSGNIDQNLKRAFGLGGKVLEIRRRLASRTDFTLERELEKAEQALAHIGDELGIDPGAFLWPVQLRIADLSPEKQLHFLSLMQQGAMAAGGRATTQAELEELKKREQWLEAHNLYDESGSVSAELADIRKQIADLREEIKAWDTVLTDLETEYDDAGFGNIKVSGFHRIESNPETAGYDVSGTGFREAIKTYLATIGVSVSQGGAINTNLEFDLAGLPGLFKSALTFGRGMLRTLGKAAVASADDAGVLWRAFYRECRQGYKGIPTSGVTNKFKEILAEGRIRCAMRYRGYQLHASKYGGGHGIDQVWVKRSANGTVTDIIAMESKFDKNGVLKLARGANKGDQMTTRWINESIDDMIARGTPEVAATGRELRRLRGLLRRKAGVVDPSGRLRFFDLDKLLGD